MNQKYKIQALDIKPGDRIIAYFKNKMQICTVKYISTSESNNIKLSVFLGEHYRYSSSGTIQFKLDTLVDLVN
ncbi:MAG: hypothetical protein AB4368_02245 [Xenococcaceae cyanobacterium]